MPIATGNPEGHLRQGHTSSSASSTNHRTPPRTLLINPALDRALSLRCIASFYPALTQAGRSGQSGQMVSALRVSLASSMWIRYLVSPTQSSLLHRRGDSHGIVLLAQT